MLRKTSLAIAIAALAAAAHAQVLTIGANATTIGHAFAPAASSTNDFLLGSHWGAAAVPSFTASLSSYSTLRVTLSAPTGYAFTINSHAASTGGVLSFGAPLSIWRAAGWDGGLRISLPTTVTLGDFSGPAPYKVDAATSVDTQGLGLVLEGAMWWSGAPQMAFRSITLESDLSSVAGSAFPVATFAPDVGFSFRFQGILPDGTSIDPGAALSLTAVPEPATYALTLALAAIAVAGVRRLRLARVR